MRDDHFCFWTHHNISVCFRATAVEARETSFFWKSLPGPTVWLCLSLTTLAYAGVGWAGWCCLFIDLIDLFRFYFEMWIGRVRKEKDYIWKASQHCISSCIPICKKFSRNWEPRVDFIISPFSFQRCCLTFRRKYTCPMLQIFPSLNYKSNNKRWQGFVCFAAVLLREKLFWNQSHVSRLGSVEARPWPRICKMNFQF